MAAIKNLMPASSLVYSVGVLTSVCSLPFDEAVQRVINEHFSDYTEEYRADLYARIVDDTEFNVGSTNKHMEVALG